MPEYEFEPVDQSPALAEDPVAAHARQLSNIVEVERRRRRRTLLLWSALLLLPLLLAAAALLTTPEPRAAANNFNSPEFAQTVAPIVQKNVGEQLGPEVDRLVESKVSGKIQGASPARVEELSKQVRQVSDEMSRTSAGLGDLQALRGELSQVREQVGANGNSVRDLQQRVETISNTRAGGDPEAVRRLEARLAEMEQKLANSVSSLQAQFEQNSSAIRSLTVRVENLNRPQRVQPKRAN